MAFLVCSLTDAIPEIWGFDSLLNVAKPNKQKNDKRIYNAKLSQLHSLPSPK